MSLYMGHGYRVAKLLFRYPSAIPRLVGGLDSTSAFIDKLVKEDYRRSPIEVKRTHGFEICLNPRDEYLSPVIGITGSYEPDVTRVFRRVLRPGRKVVDVGANVGWFTLLAATMVGKEGVVVSFEPEPRTFSFLASSVERNGFKNVVLLNRAASDVDGTQTLFMHEDQSLGNSIVRDFGRGSVVVPSSKLDTVARDHGLDVIDLVKVDAEGAEPLVVSGMRQLIADGRVSHMVLEWNPKEWSSHEELLSSLFRTFDVYSVNRLSLRPLTRVYKESIPSSALNLYLEKR